MENTKFRKLRQGFIRTISILFSIFFAIILVNTIFFNRTIAIRYNIPTMIIGTCIIYLIIFLTYYKYKSKKLSFLDWSTNKAKCICILLIIFLIQLVFILLTCYFCGWDCGRVISDANALLNGENLKALYYAQYPNNIGILLLIKYVLAIAKVFTHTSTMYTAFLSSLIFNVFIVDI